jgi:ketosteroid isomerase-like protein
MGSTAARTGDAAGAIRKLDADFVANFRAGDAAKLVNDFYAENARVLPPNQQAVAGRQAITDFWKAVLASGVTNAGLNTTHIDVSGDLAYAVGEYTISRTDGDLSGKYTVVYRRQPDGGWRAVVDMFSPNE